MVVDPDVEDHILFLKQNFKPHEKILSSWKKTFTSRKIELSNIDIGKYFETYPVLKQPSGYLLLLDDFNEIFPNRETKFLDSWPELSGNILDALNRKKLKDLPEFDAKDAFKKGK